MRELLLQRGFLPVEVDGLLRVLPGSIMAWRAQFGVVPMDLAAALARSHVEVSDSLWNAYIGELQRVRLAGSVVLNAAPPVAQPATVHDEVEPPPKRVKMSHWGAFCCPYRNCLLHPCS